jgi:hypothetical protein
MRIATREKETRSTTTLAQEAIDLLEEARRCRTLAANLIDEKGRRAFLDFAAECEAGAHAIVGRNSPEDLG